MRFYYLRNEMDEEYYGFLCRMQRRVTQLSTFGSHLEVDERRKFLRDLGIDEVDVDSCGRDKINSIVAAVRSEISDYKSQYQKWRREREAGQKPVQGEFEFSGSMGDWRPDLSNRLDPSTMSRRVWC